MSGDDRRPPRKTVPWWQIATLVVTVARFAVDLVRKGWEQGPGVIRPRGPLPPAAPVPPRVSA